MKLRSLILSLFLLVASIGKSFAFTPGESAAPIIDSQSYSFDGQTNTAKTMGAIMIASDGTVWLFGKYDSGPNIGKWSWGNVSNLVTSYDYQCYPLTASSGFGAKPVWTSVLPFEDGTSVSFCGGVSCAVAASGTYRPLGDGNGGPRRGVMFRDNTGRQFLLVVKTANTEVGSGGCTANNFTPQGPGVIGQWILMEIKTTNF